MKAVDRMWLIGDDFCYYTVQRFFKEVKIDNGNTHALYSFNTFDVSEYVSSKYKSHNKSVIGRILNNLIYTLNNCKANLPKLIVMVLDDDVAKNVSDMQGTQLKIVTDWLLTECEKCIWVFKSQLLLKAVKANYPHVLWLCPPMHKYFGSSNNTRRSIRINITWKFCTKQSSLSLIMDFSELEK